MDIVITKVLTLCGMLILNLFFGLLPIKLASLGNNSDRERLIKRILSFLSCYAGGIFLATCLLDLLPTVRDNLSLVFDQLQIYTSFPITEFIMAMGLFLIVIVEQTVLSCQERRGDGDVTKPLLDGGYRKGRNHGAINSEENNEYFEEQSDHFIRGGSESTLVHGHSHGQVENHSHDDPHAHSRLRSYILLLALSIHSIFEGLAVGLQSDNEGVIEIFTALSIHKCLLSFSLGMNLVQSRLTKGAVFRSILCFAVAAPIGIAIGIGVMESQSDFTSSLINGVLQGLATGTFLYVTFFEVLPHEMNEPTDRLLKVLCIILGFSTICGLLFLHSNVIRPTCYRSAEPL